MGIASNSKSWVLLWAGFVLITFIPGLVYLRKHIKESEIVRNYIIENGFDELPFSRESTFIIAKQVAEDFNVDVATFKALNLDDRPFLREDAGYLLTYKEGLCGEGTRVIIRILNVCGYDATRITLFDRNIQNAHTLISVRMNGNEFWIDSINSSDSFTSLLQGQMVSIQNFSYLFYTDNINQRLRGIKDYDGPKSSTSQEHLGKYFILSYEAVPITKVLSSVGIKMRVFNFERPPHLISVLAEEPNMIMFILLMLLAVILNLIVVIGIKKFKIR